MDHIEQSIVDDTEDPECRECRKRICYRNNMIPEGVADVLYSKKERVFQFTDEAGMIAVKHLRECSDCQAWFRSIIPKEILERNDKASSYCCMLMFCAVEEHDLHSHLPKFHFGPFRDDELWWIEGKLACASFCPWCGTKLPDRPFREPADQGGVINSESLRSST
jgi:hypothetical protein